MKTKVLLAFIGLHSAAMFDFSTPPQKLNLKGSVSR
jgi:hypothetical protein